MGVYSRKSGDSFGQAALGVGVVKRTAVDGPEFATSCVSSSLTRGSIACEEAEADLTLSPESMEIHASTDRERSSRKTYLTLHNILHPDEQKPMAA